MKPKTLWSAAFLVLIVVLVWSNPATRIEKDRLSEIVRQLASEEFQGRAPGTVGEVKTLAYLTDYFTSLGLSPGGKQGSWTQAVPLIHTQLQSPFNVVINSGKTQWQVQQAMDLEVSTIQATPHVRIQDAALVFVGFGASAPERNWDDYGDIDLSGKVAIFLVNDPDFAAQPGEAVMNRFGNRRMTYYGRWTYKFEEAARRGAVAALVIHEDRAAGYGWNVASSSPGENYSIVNTGVTQNGLKLQGWLHGEAATRLFDIAGLDLQQLRTAARQPQFEAFTLDEVSFSADLAVKVESIESQNLLARLPGTDQVDETIMVSAHWDAYGIGAADEQGRVVRPGANDDALGVAGVMELARVLKQGPTPARSIVFALWTAEESGLLGSAFYAQDPIYPTAKTVANFTLDILQTAGLARDVILVGEGQSELETDLARAALTQGRTVTPESLPENGLFFRADHFSLAKAGVPVLLLMGIAGGADLVEGGRTAGDQWVSDYISACYHQTCDAWDPAWDLSGAVQDVELFQLIIEDLADSRRWPEWQEGSEFKAIRQQSSHQRQ
ncbi:MAG: M20/M25/M40 family metallo-hydrolase [Gammaproteobacteria bacterium]|nr:M20/M25/M40 family metallo-hydrolase [Gammaproteobacteria bacterium]